jgi:phage terminase large subunit-like protein
LKHDGNPAMTWMISNVVCHRDAKDNIYPRKEQPGNKIDGAVAAISALGLMLKADETVPDTMFLGVV